MRTLSGLTARPAATAAAVAAALALAACGSSGGGSPTPAAGSAPAINKATAGSALDLAGVCPSTIAVQTDWNPESEHGGLYRLMGPGYSIDTGKKRVTGPLVAGNVDTGVKIEVRAGGPAIGFQQVSAQLYTDPGITLGYVSTDEATQNSAKQPTLAVVAPLERNPQMIMWDPTRHPGFKTIADIGKTDTKVLYFQGATYMDYLISRGILKKSQVDGSYDGSPARFVTSRGEVTQQGYATAEPYIYQHEVSAWNKPVAFTLIEDAGFRQYQSSLAIPPKRKAELAACLKKLVPIVQQAEVDFITSPAATNALILELVKKYNNGWVYSAGVADFAVTQMRDLGIVGNGPDATLGNFDFGKVQRVIDNLSPVFAAQHKAVKPGLKPTDLVTNEFINPAIGLR
jgi:hypothetical protein